MKKLIVIYLALSCLFSACNRHEHAHEEKSNEPEALAYTIYTDKTELFLEFKPLLIGKEARFAAHFTHLGEYFKPFTEGSITLTLEVNGKKTSIQTDTLMVPGIFRLRMTPPQPGKGRLVFDIKTKNITDQIIIEDVVVHSDEATALLANPPGESGGNDISYLKEQAWKVEFANTPVKKQPFSETVKATGQILSAPGDEVIVAAKSSGIVHFIGQNTIGTTVTNGESLFMITGGDVTEGNVDVRFKEAKAIYDKTKADLDRSNELIKDNLITQKDYIQRQNDFEIAQTQYNAIAKNYSSGGQKVTASLNGFLKNIYVNEGQYMNAGEPLASISQNRRLILKAEVSQKYFNKLKSFNAANFKTPYDNRVYSTTEVNGKLLSYGKSTSENTPFIPVSFEIDNKGDIIPGSYVELYLKSDPIADALVIPLSALIEEQGVFYVYVQVEGERFQKREVKLGTNDGITVQVLAGVKEGERVVNKGAYQIKLATMSGAMPAHGHEH
jgi:cobalt-zinc-cadmium efflux system membrane fusion protein